MIAYTRLQTHYGTLDVLTLLSLCVQQHLQKSTIPNCTMKHAPVSIGRVCNIDKSPLLCTWASGRLPLKRSATSFDELAAVAALHKRVTSTSSACTDACALANRSNALRCLSTLLSPRGALQTTPQEALAGKSKPYEPQFSCTHEKFLGKLYRTSIAPDGRISRRFRSASKSAWTAIKSSMTLSVGEKSPSRSSLQSALAPWLYWPQKDDVL